MNIDERLESLARSIEMLTAMQQLHASRRELQAVQLCNVLEETNSAVRALVRIVSEHESWFYSFVRTFENLPPDSQTQFTQKPSAVENRTTAEGHRTAGATTDRVKGAEVSVMAVAGELMRGKRDRRSLVRRQSRAHLGDKA